MDITRELVSLIMGVVALVAIAGFFLSAAQIPTTGIGSEKFQASEDIGRLVSQCCRKHAGSYRTYNDDCTLMDISIQGEVTKDMVAWYVPEECEFEMSEDIITGSGKIKITYLGRERKVRISVIN